MHHKCIVRGCSFKVKLCKWIIFCYKIPQTHRYMPKINGNLQNSPHPKKHFLTMSLQCSPSRKFISDALKQNLWNDQQIIRMTLFAWKGQSEEVVNFVLIRGSLSYHATVTESPCIKWRREVEPPLAASFSVTPVNKTVGWLHDPGTYNTQKTIYQVVAI